MKAGVDAAVVVMQGAYMRWGISGGGSSIRKVLSLFFFCVCILSRVVEVP